jgi:hypothetical protein
MEEPQERFRYVIFAGHWANAATGVIRASALARTRLMPTYSVGDRRVLGELSLLGKFYEVPETLFERRLHPGSSSQHGTSGTNPDPKWLVHYCTGSSRSLSLPHWGINIDHFRTILRSQLPIRQKLSLTRSLLHHMRWQRGKLSGELLGAIAAYFPKRRPAGGPHLPPSHCLNGSRS